MSGDRFSSASWLTGEMLGLPQRGSLSAAPKGVTPSDANSPLTAVVLQVSRQHGHPDLV